MQRHKPTHQPKSALPRGTGACGGGSGDSQGLVWAGQGGTLSARPDRSHCCHPQGRPALLTCTPQAASSFSIAASCLTASPRCSASTTVAGWLQGRPSTTPVPPPPLWLPAPPPLPAQDQDSQAFQAIDTPLLNATRQSVGTKRKLTRCAIGQTCGAWGQAAGVGSGRAAGVGSGSGHQHVGATLPLGTRARLREAQLTAATPQSSPRTTMAAHSRHACQMQVPTPARESHTRLTHHQIASVDPPDLLLDGGQDQLGVPLQGLQQCKENAGLQQHDSSTTSAPAAWHQRQESQRVSMSSRHQQPASAESIGSKATSLAAGLAGGRGGAECGLVCMAGTACRWRPAQLSSPAQPSPAQPSCNPAAARSPWAAPTQFGPGRSWSAQHAGLVDCQAQCACPAACTWCWNEGFCFGQGHVLPLGGWRGLHASSWGGEEGAKEESAHQAWPTGPSISRPYRDSRTPLHTHNSVREWPPPCRCPVGRQSSAHRHPPPWVVEAAANALRQSVPNGEANA